MKRLLLYAEIENDELKTIQRKINLTDKELIYIFNKLIKRAEKNGRI